MNSQDPVIVIFDADENYTTVADIICFNLGLTLSASIKNVAEARVYFQQIAEKKSKPDIAIVTDFLERDENDGQAIAKKLRSLLPEIKIISYSFVEESWADAIAIKSSKEVSGSLISALSSLTKREFKSSNI